MRHPYPISILLSLQVRGLTPLHAGEELCYTYLSSPHLTVDERRQLLRASFLFTCRCGRCVEEERRGDARALSCPTCGAQAVLSSAQGAKGQGSEVLVCAGTTAEASCGR